VSRWRIPSLFATIDPNSVDRIEITRGPQASTIYGAGALAGVMQIFTKKGQFGLTRPEVTGKVSAGSVAGFDGSGSALQTDNAVSVVGGEEKTSYTLGGSYRRIGEWVPSYHSTDWNLSAGGQASQGPLTLSGFGRYADKSIDSPFDTRLRSYTYYSKPFYYPYRVRQQTYGLTASVRATSKWTHALTIGYDQSSFGFDQTQPRFTTPADSFLTISAIREAKTSFLYHTDLSLRLSDRVASTVTAGANSEAFDYASSSTFRATRTTGQINGVTTLRRTPWTTPAISARCRSASRSSYS